MESQNGSRPDPLSIAMCISLLRLRNFPRCREIALEVSNSDPEISDSVQRLLAIADVQIAASNRIDKENPNWYAILQIPPMSLDDSGNYTIMRDNFKRLMHLLDPERNQYPYSKESFYILRDAWKVLSQQESRAQYERSISDWLLKECGNVNNANHTFWTLCPYCWVLCEYDKIYQDCTLRCQKCKKVFQAIPVKPPGNDMLVKGKEQYYCYCAHVPLRYPPSQNRWGTPDKCKNNGNVFVDILDDDEQSRPFDGFREDLGNGKRRGRVKTTVAINTKKITGNPMKSQIRISRDRDAELSDLDVEDDDDDDDDDDDLEFTGENGFASVPCANC